MKKLLIAALLALAPGLAWADSTIDPTIPAANSQLLSASIRSNFQAAINDINNLQSSFAGVTAPTSPRLYQRWVNTSVTPALESIWDGSQWVSIAAISSVLHQWSPRLTGAADFGSPLFQSTTTESALAGTNFVISNVLQSTRAGGSGHRETLGIILNGSTALGSEFMAAGQATAHATGGSGLYFGWNPYCWIDASVATTAQCTGEEVNTDIRNASVISKTGVQIVDTANSTGLGTAIDAGLFVTNQTGGRGYGNGIQFGTGVANPGIATGGSVLVATGGQITNGIDLSRMTGGTGLITGSAWLSPGLTIGGTGQLSTSQAPIFSTLTGYLKGNGGSALTAAASVPTTDLSGTLQAAQEPAHTGTCTNTAGSLALSCTQDGAWTTYTPTVTWLGTAPTAFNVTGSRYKQIGSKTYAIAFMLNVTTLGPGTGVIEFSLPVAANSTFACPATNVTTIASEAGYISGVFAVMNPGTMAANQYVINCTYETT